jgi:hypothetical protein
MDHESQPGRPAVHHETSDVNVRGVIAFGIGLLVAALLIHAGVWLLYVFFMAREGRPVSTEFPLAAGQGNRLPPEPRFQTHPREDLRRLREQEDRILNSYGWVDQSAGVVRIPVRRAMELTVQRGLPARPEAGQNTGQSNR